MTLQQLRYFLSVCEYGGMAKAAQETNISQPAISVTIRELEKEFDIQLFLRMNKKLILTEEGVEFRHMALNLVHRADQMEAYFREKGKAPQRIKVGISYVYNNLLAPSIGKFRKRNPNIRLVTFFFGKEEVAELLESGSVDLLIMGTSALDDLSAYNTRDICTCTPCLYTYKDNPLAQKEVVSSQDLQDEPIVLLSEQLDYKKLINSMKFLLPDLQLNNIVAYTNQLNTVIDMILAHQASVIIGRGAFSVREDIVERPLLNAKPFNVTAIWKKSRYLSAAAIKLLNSMEM